jgi:type I restriction enzyme, S subunit
MKTKWQTKKLGEVCDFQNGFAFKSSKYKREGFPILRITNIQNDNIDEKNLVYINPQDCKEDLERYLVNEGDLLIAMSGATTGKIGFNKTKKQFYLNQRVGKFVPKKSLDLKFLFYFLYTRVEENLRISQGAAQPNLSTEQIKSFQIPLPPLATQKAIVKILDEVFESISKSKENAEKNLKNAKELFESYLEEIFSNPKEDWEEKKLGEVLKLEYGKPLDKKDRNANGKYPIYGANGEKNRSDKFYYDKNSIIVGRKGSAGEVNLTEEKFWPLDVTYFVTFDDKKYNLLFIYYLLKKLNLPSLAKGVKPGINRNEVYSIRRCFPKSLTEQKTIVQKLDSLSSEVKQLEEIYKQKLKDLEELKKSMLQKAFTGELTKE